MYALTTKKISIILFLTHNGRTKVPSMSSAFWRPRRPGRRRTEKTGWYYTRVYSGGSLAYQVDWPLPDNHIYLLAYWCLASRPGVACRGCASAAGTRAARLLVGLAFLFAVLWKVVLSPDYLDGRFFRVTLMMDDRFAGAVMLMTGLSVEQLKQNRDYLQALPEGGNC
jgi:hypothetical protein